MPRVAAPRFRAGAQCLANCARPCAAYPACAVACTDSVIQRAASSPRAFASTATKPKLELYMRQLPTGCVDWNSEDGRALFREALLEGGMESYFPLAAQFTTQADPAYCGLGTLAMVLNALNIDPGRVWKGPWRWYHESMLDCCVPLSIVQEKGISLDTFACLARCNGAAATVTRASDDGALQQFRAAVRAASQVQAGSFLIAAYSRKALGQTGDGHYSPIAGYHAGRDMVLIMDVARFKYPPHWVPLTRLFEAMQKLDPDTSKPRGFVVVRRSAAVPLVLFAVGSGSGNGYWPHTHAPSVAAAAAAAVAAPVSPRADASLGTAVELASTAGTSAGGGGVEASMAGRATTAASSCGSCGTDNHSCSTHGSGVSTSSSSSSSSGGGNCQGQGQTIASAATQLRAAAILLERARVRLDGTARGGRRKGRTAHEESVDAALRILLGGVAESGGDGGDGSAHPPLRITFGGSSVIATDSDGQCMTRLSREQVAAAAALLNDVEKLPLYHQVRHSLETGRYHSYSAGGSAAGKSHEGLMTAATDHAGDSDSDSDTHAHHNKDSDADDGVDPTVATLVMSAAGSNGNGPKAAASPSSPTAAAAAAAASSSGAEVAHSHEHAPGVTCVRVHQAHVLTVLLLVLYARGGETAAAVAAVGGSSGGSPSFSPAWDRATVNAIVSAATAAQPAAVAAATSVPDVEDLVSSTSVGHQLTGLVADSLAVASPLITAEISLLRGQMQMELEAAV